MIMNVKGLMQAEWLTGDGWLFELYTISNILYQVPRGPWLRLHLLPACRLQRRGPAACCINHPYRIQHLGLRLHSAPFSSLLLISDEIPSPLCRDALRLGTAASRTGWWCDDTVCPNVIETSCRISMNMSLFIEQKPAGLPSARHRRKINMNQYLSHLTLKSGNKSLPTAFSRLNLWHKRVITLAVF